MPISEMHATIAALSRSLEAHMVAYPTETLETAWEIENRRWVEDVAVIPDWISLGRFASFEDVKKREIEGYTPRCLGGDRHREIVPRERVRPSRPAAFSLGLGTRFGTSPTPVLRLTRVYFERSRTCADK